LLQALQQTLRKNKKGNLIANTTRTIAADKMGKLNAGKDQGNHQTIEKTKHPST